MKLLKSVFWDVDGTLADTEINGHRVAFNKAFEEFKLHWSWDTSEYIELLQTQGGLNRIRKYASQTSTKLTDDDFSRLHELKQYFYRREISLGNVPLRTGVKRLVTELAFNGIEQWIVTTSSRKALNPLLDSIFRELQLPFRGFITYEDVLHHKPSPDAYLLAREKCGLPRENCLVIEDSLAGLSSANAASMTCLITLSPWNKRKYSEFLSAQAVVDHLGDNNNHCSVLHGLPCQDGIVNLEYLEDLLHNQ